MSLELTQPVNGLASQAEKNLPEPYGKRFRRQVFKSTYNMLVTQQVIMTFVLSVLGVLFTYLFGLVPEALARQPLTKQTLLVVCPYAVVFLVIVLINVIRAPFILDRAQNQIIAELAGQLRSTEEQLAGAQRRLKDTAIQLESIEAAAGRRTPQANLVFNRVRVIQASIDRYVDEDEDGLVTTLIEFKNDAEAPFPPADAIVRASIHFEEVNGQCICEVPDGVWLNERTRSTRFRLNDIKGLVVAVQKDGRVRTLAVRKKSIFRQAVKFEFHDLPPGEYNVVVRLVAEKPSVLLGKYEFRLITHPELQLEAILSSSTSPDLHGQP